MLMILTFPVVAYSLKVSFSSQAPFFHWTQPWQDACEETSIIMVDSFYNQKHLDKDAAKKQILNTLKIKELYFGESLDENASKVTELINNFFYWEAKVVHNASVEQIKNELDYGRPVILPAHAKSLKNKYFLSSGADYHMLVISGYDENTREFITQDPGTMYGKDYHYSYETIINAMHDFVPNNKTITGQKVAVFTSPKINLSATVDADHDGLYKSDEIKHQTSLFKSDTDNDGYSDYEEVQNGYSPVVNESKLKNNALIRSAIDNKVYFIENNTKRYIISPSALEKYWQWGQITTVSEKFINQLINGAEIK